MTILMYKLNNISFLLIFSSGLTNYPVVVTEDIFVKYFPVPIHVWCNNIRFSCGLVHTSKKQQHTDSIDGVLQNLGCTKDQLHATFAFFIVTLRTLQGSPAE